MLRMQKGFRASGYFQVFRGFVVHNPVNLAKVDILGYER
jgi:hypothetical protein